MATFKKQLKRLHEIRGKFRAVEEPHELDNKMWIKVQHIDHPEQFDIVFLDWWEGLEKQIIKV